MEDQDLNHEAWLKKVKEEQQKAPKTIIEIMYPPMEDQDRNGWLGVEIDAENFELKPGLIRLVQQNQFGGNQNDDANAHLDYFLAICDTLKINGVPPDAIRLRLFSFSLRDKAESWYWVLDRSTIKTWEDLRFKFLRRFFPPWMVLEMRRAITQFTQFADEPLFEAWERYRGMLWKCRGHGFTKRQQVWHFYDGLACNIQMLADASAGGSLLSLTGKDAMVILEKMAASSYEWPEDRRTAMSAEQNTNDSETRARMLEDMLQKFIASTDLRLNILDNRMDKLEVNIGEISQSAVRMCDEIERLAAVLESNQIVERPSSNTRTAGHTGEF